MEGIKMIKEISPWDELRAELKSIDKLQAFVYKFDWGPLSGHERFTLEMLEFAEVICPANWLYCQEEWDKKFQARVADILSQAAEAVLKSKDFRNTVLANNIIGNNVKWKNLTDLCKETK